MELPVSDRRSLFALALFAPLLLVFALAPSSAPAGGTAPAKPLLRTQSLVGKLSIDSGTLLDDSSYTGSAVVERVCFYPLTSDYSAIRGSVLAHTVKPSDGGVARVAEVVIDMSGANLAAAQNMISNQALPIWQANQQ